MFYEIDVRKHNDKHIKRAAKDAKKVVRWASLVAQWLGICLPMQGTRVLSPGLGGSHMPRSN